MLVDQINIPDDYDPQILRWSNTVGTPLASVELTDQFTGQLIAGVYTVEITGAGNLSVTADSPNNPYTNNFAGASFDGTTSYSIVLPGLDIVFGAGAVVGNIAVINVGVDLGTVSADGVGTGIPSDGVQHAVYNDGAATVSDARARVLTQAIHISVGGLSSKLLSRVGSFAEDAVEKTAGGGSDRIMPYILSIANILGSGPTKTVDLYLDGVIFGVGTIRDRLTGDLVSGVGLKAIDEQSYYIVSGPLQSLTFNISPLCVDSNTARILIFYNRYLEIAPDLGDVAGEYGSDDVTLTQSGQADGQINPAGTAYYWARILVPGDANHESNPYPANVALTGTELSGAGW